MERFRTAATACKTTVFWHASRTPVEVLRAVAADAEAMELTEWDVYAERGPVAEVERQVAELLGKPAAAFFPSGVMAQQAALRVWTDRAGSKRVAIPDLSHLLKHEDDGPRRLHGFEFEHLTTGRATATADDLRALAPGSAPPWSSCRCATPAACCPSWDDLAALSAAARELGVPLHADGARIWESQPFYDRPLAEIAGAVRQRLRVVLQGSRGARRRGARRAGGRRGGGPPAGASGWAARSSTSRRSPSRRWPGCVTGCRAWASTPRGRATLATELSARGLRPDPAPPHTNTFLIHAEGEADAIVERVIAFMEREKIQPCGGWWDAAASPGSWRPRSPSTTPRSSTTPPRWPSGSWRSPAGDRRGASTSTGRSRRCTRSPRG